MGSENHDTLVIAILCILDNLISIAFNMIIVKRIFQEKYQPILMIVAQLFPWSLFIFIQNYDEYYINMIQLTFCIIFSVLTFVYIIWNECQKKNSENLPHSQECININNLEKVSLLEKIELDKQQQTSNYGFNLEFEAQSSFEQKYLHQIFQQDTLYSLRELNLNSYDIIEFQYYDSQYLNYTIMDVIDKCLRQIDAQQNFEDIKIAIWNNLKQIQDKDIQSKILDISKTLQQYNKIREQINVLVIGKKISHQGLSNNKMILILSESQQLLGYYIENKITKKIESLPSDLTTFNLNRNYEIIFQKFEISNIGNFLAQIINDLVIQQFGQKYQILESKWSQYLQRFNFLNNANQLQHQLKEDNFTFLLSFYKCSFNIQIFCISYSHNLVEEINFYKQGKQFTLYIDIEKNQIGFQVIRQEEDISYLTHQMADQEIKLDQSQQQILQRESLSSIGTSSEKIFQQDHLQKDQNDNVENNEEEFKNKQQQESIHNQREYQNLGEEDPQQILNQNQGEQEQNIVQIEKQAQLGIIDIKKEVEIEPKNILSQFQYQENTKSQTVQQLDQIVIEIKDTDSDLKTQQIDIIALKNDLNNQPPQFQNVYQVCEPIETNTIQNAYQDGRDQPPQFQYDNQKQIKQVVQTSQQVKQGEIEINQSKKFNQPPQFQNIIQAQEEASSQITLDNNQIQQYKEQYQKQHYDTVNKTITQNDSNSTDNTNQEVQQQKHQYDSSINSKKVDYQSYLIINQKFYLASFKQRKVEDKYLQKFIRGQKDVQQYQEEYNLDGSQEELLNNQILKFVPIRGDGNCMFTSIGFQYLYYNLIDEGRYQRLLELIEQTEFKQKYENQQVEAEEEQNILRCEFSNYLKELKNKQLEIFTQIKDKQQQLLQMLQELEQTINNHDGPLYGLMVIFLRNYFRKILQDFYDNDEMNWQIQDPKQINELIIWEFMYDEADIALKLFAQKEKILIKCFRKMNIENKIVDISDYHDDNQKEFSYKIGLAFQPGHYNAILVKN